MIAAANTFRIPRQSGAALRLPRGATLRVTDPTGEQVADLTAFASADTREWLSSGRTIDYNTTIYVTKGHTLYSNRSKPMLTITRDDAGRHDFLLTPCSQEMFERLHGVTGHHPSCFENLSRNLEAYGITPDAIPTTLNIFMDVAVAPDGALTINAPSSRAGDCIELRAEMDLIVGLTACSSELTNNGTCKPIDVEVLAREIEDPRIKDQAPVDAR